MRTGTRIGFLGAGQMAEALAYGILASGYVPPYWITACDLSKERQKIFTDMGASIAPNIRAVVRQSRILLLCVKPQQSQEVMHEAAGVFKAQRHLLVSIAAGVTTRKLEAYLPAGARVVRCMPNTPMLVKLGATCICAGQHASAEDMKVVTSLLSSASMVMPVKESMMDAVTGLSGSGPAYLFYLVEAMVQAGVAEGFSEEEALQLARRTCLGAAQMLEKTGASPEELRRRVTSPNGATQAAIEQLDGHEVKARITAAVRRAAERSRELGR